MIYIGSVASNWQNKET